MLLVLADIVVRLGGDAAIGVQPRVEVRQALAVLRLALAIDGGLQRLVGIVGVARAVRTPGLLGLEPVHESLLAGDLVLQLLEVGGGEGGVEVGQHLPLLHHVAGVDVDAADHGLVERLDEEGAAGGQDAAAGGDPHPVEPDHAHQEDGREQHGRHRVQDGVLAVGAGAADDVLGLRLEGADRAGEDVDGLRTPG